MIKFERKRVSFTRNRMRWGLVLLVTLVLLLIVSFDSSVFKSRETVSCLGRDAQPVGVISGDEPLVQTFVPEKSHVDFMEIRLATNVEAGNVSQPQGNLIFRVLDAKENILYEETTALLRLKDNAYQRYYVGLNLESGKPYTFTLQTEGTIGEEIPTVWVSSNEKDELTHLQFPGLAEDDDVQCNIQIRYSEMDYAAMITSILLILLCAVLALLHVDLSDRGKERTTLAVLFLMPILMFVITEMLNNNSVLVKTPAAYLVNYAFYLLLYVILFVAFNKFRLTTIIANSVIFAIAIFNYFKFLWRGEPIQVWDVVTLQTAINVSGNYHINLSPILIIAALLFILSILIISKCSYAMLLKRMRVTLGAVGVVLAAFLIPILFHLNFYRTSTFNLIETVGVENYSWNQPGNFQKNGMLIALTMSAQDVTVKVPEGYGEEAVSEIKDEIEQSTVHNILPDEVMAKYEEEKPIHEQAGQRVLKEGEKPTIICIMNESYTDMSTVADFETNLPLHPYMDQLFEEENVIHGDLGVSTFGGGTANSEFEFLTGSSMSFFPIGSIPYQQYVTSSTGSLPRYLKTQGYETIAVHPYLASGWNRPDVYERMDFDEFLSIDDFSSDAEYLRSYISDRSSYAKLIELYEAKEPGHPLFLFNVTMQNHGSYSSTNPNFNQDVKLVEYPEKFTETEQYLSLARQSDAAVQDLIDYFSSVDEPVIICFFGDHLPSMENGFYQAMLGKDTMYLTGEEMQQLYQTDFFIWANYDLPEYEVPQISLNYLSTLVLQMSGLPLPEYNLLIAETYDQYPYLTTMGVYDAQGNRYNSLSEVQDETGILNDYNILTYNNIFENGKRRSELFDEIKYIPKKEEDT